MIAVSKHISNKYNKFILKCSIFVINIVINVSPMKFNFIESHRTTAEEQDEVLRRTSRRGRWRRVAPLGKGLSLQRLGIKTKGISKKSLTTVRRIP